MIFNSADLPDFQIVADSFSAVLAKIAEIVPMHPNFKRDLGKSDASTFQYVFAQRNDANREITLTVLVFDVPNGGRRKASSRPACRYFHRNKPVPPRRHLTGAARDATALWALFADTHPRIRALVLKNADAQASHPVEEDTRAGHDPGLEFELPQTVHLKACAFHCAGRDLPT